MKSRWMHRLAGAIVIVLLLVLILGYASAIVLVRGMLNHRVVRNAHTLAETGLPGTTVAPHSVDGVPLSGFWIPAETAHGVVLLLHDMGGIAPRPVLIMHGSKDSQVPVENAQLLKSGGGNTVELDIVEGAGHIVFVGDGGGPEDEPYRDAILTFLSGIH